MLMKKILLGFMILSLFTACSSDDMSVVNEADVIADTPVEFNPEVEDAEVRSGYPAGKLTEGMLGFYMKTAGANSSDTRYCGDNRKVGYENGKWVLDGSPLLWRSATDEVKWQAYYPYAEENIIDGILTVTIPTDQNKDGVYDLLYAEGTTNGNDSRDGINIELEHVMSKFIVNMTVGTELGEVEFESVMISDIFTQCEFEIYNKRWWDGLGVPGNVNMIKNADASFEALLIPYVTSQLNVDITLKDGRKFFYKRGTTEFRKGMVHTLDIKIGGDKVKAKAMSAAEWIDSM